MFSHPSQRGRLGRTLNPLLKWRLSLPFRVELSQFLSKVNRAWEVERRRTNGGETVNTTLSGSLTCYGHSTLGPTSAYHPLQQRISANGSRKNFGSPFNGLSSRLLSSDVASPLKSIGHSSLDPSPSFSPVKRITGNNSSLNPPPRFHHHHHSSSITPIVRARRLFDHNNDRLKTGSSSSDSPQSSNEWKSVHQDYIMTPSSSSSLNLYMGLNAHSSLFPSPLNNSIIQPGNLRSCLSTPSFSISAQNCLDKQQYSHTYPFPATPSLQQSKARSKQPSHALRLLVRQHQLREKAEEIAAIAVEALDSRSCQSYRSKDAGQWAKRIQGYKRRRHVHINATSADGTRERVKAFLQLQKSSQQHLVMANRGIYISGWRNARQNLGNLLNISEKYIAALDRNPSQSLPLMHHSNGPLYLGSSLPTLTFITLVEEEVMTSPLKSNLFKSATTLIQSVFASKNIDMDLSNCQDAFSIDVLIPYGSIPMDEETGPYIDGNLPLTHEHSATSTCPDIFGVVEYVQMRGYLWIECIGVSPILQGRGIGSRLVHRMQELARQLSKPILLYSLMDVLSFYQTHGFKQSVKFPPKSWHIGRFLEWDSSSECQAVCCSIFSVAGALFLVGFIARPCGIGGHAPESVNPFRHTLKFALGVMYHAGVEELVDGKPGEVPVNPLSTARACYIAAALYAVTFAFCFCQSRLHTKKNAADRLLAAERRARNE